MIVRPLWFKLFAPVPFSYFPKTWKVKLHGTPRCLQRGHFRGFGAFADRPVNPANPVPFVVSLVHASGPLEGYSAAFLRIPASSFEEGRDAFAAWLPETASLSWPPLLPSVPGSAHRSDDQ